MSGWTFAVGDAHHIDIVTVEGPPVSAHGRFSNAALNGSYNTKLAAVDEALRQLEAERSVLGASIARLKRMRRRLQRRDALARAERNLTPAHRILPKASVEARERRNEP